MPVEQETLNSTELASLPAKSCERSKALAPLTVDLPLRMARPLPRGQKVFAEALLEASSTRQRFSGRRVFYSIAIHTLVLLALILPPLYFTDTINLKQFTQTFLVAPPPPPPPPPAPQAIAKAVVLKRVFTNAGKLVAPTVIPQKIAILKEEPIDPEIGAGAPGGIPGGVPGGQLGGVIGGIISDASRRASVAPPPLVQKTAPLRVGGHVRAPRLITKVAPSYPPLARQTRVQGDVTVDAVIDTGGNVVEMQIISGHPLLLSAALLAVKQWKYEPTYLNDQPIPVQLIVVVTFRLER